MNKHTPEPVGKVSVDMDGHPSVELNNIPGMDWRHGAHVYLLPPTEEEVGHLLDEMKRRREMRLAYSHTYAKGINPEAVGDLVAALNGLLEYFATYEEDYSTDPDGPTPIDVFVRGRAAIAKVEGK